MTWISRAVEERLAQAAANGELETPTLNGRPIADLDRPRQAGWWAEQFVERERSHDRRAVAEQAAARARVGFWHCVDVDVVRAAVDTANAAIATANRKLIASDRIAPFDVDDVADRWRGLRR